jgi:hypothetical protein
MEVRTKKVSRAVTVDAIVKYIEKGNGYGGVLKLNDSLWRLSRSTFLRYWNIASEQHIAAQQVIKKVEAEMNLESAIEGHKGHIADVRERKEVLTKILRGEIPLRKPIVVNFCIEYIEVLPDWMDRKAAIAELNKMEGDYAPTKVEETITFAKPVIIESLWNKQPTVVYQQNNLILPQPE